MRPTDRCLLNCDGPNPVYLIDIDGVEYTIQDRQCACRTWPVAIGSGVGRCGFCGVQPTLKHLIGGN